MDAPVIETVDGELCLPGLVCPMPILRAKKALRGLEPGTLLRVVTTDPHAPADFELFCSQTGHRCVEQRTREGDSGTEYVTVIEKRRD